MILNNPLVKNYLIIIVIDLKIDYIYLWPFLISYLSLYVKGTKKKTNNRKIIRSIFLAFFFDFVQDRIRIESNRTESESNRTEPNSKYFEHSSNFLQNKFWSLKSTIFSYLRLNAIFLYAPHFLIFCFRESGSSLALKFLTFYIVSFNNIIKYIIKENKNFKSVSNNRLTLVIKENKS